jgi:hypothetical protein
MPCTLPSEELSMSQFLADWTSADWVAVLSSIILFVAGAWVSKVLGDKQEKTIREVHVLQSAIAELQIREKIGVMRGDMTRLEGTKNKRSGANEVRRLAELLVQNSLSVLPLFRYAPERLQIEYRDIVNQVLSTLSETRGASEQLQILFRIVGEEVARLELTKEIGAPILKGAITQMERSHG